MKRLLLVFMLISGTTIFAMENNNELQEGRLSFYKEAPYPVIVWVYSNAQGTLRGGHFKDIITNWWKTIEDDQEKEISSALDLGKGSIWGPIILKLQAQMKVNGSIVNSPYYVQSNLKVGKYLIEGNDKGILRLYNALRNFEEITLTNEVG